MKNYVLAITLSVLALITGLVWLANSSNVQAPAGYATYVVEKPILGSTKFEDVIFGPNSTGLSWRLRGDLVSVTPYSYSEEFNGTSAVIAKDKLPIIANAHLVFRIRADKQNIRDYMEKFGGLDEYHSPDQVAGFAYTNYIKEPFRTLIRAELATKDGLEIPDNVAAMSETITKSLQLRLKDTPFEVLQVVIGNAQPPAVVLEQISLKVAKQQEFERKVTEQSIANANKNIQKAEGEAAGEKDLALATQRALANNQLSASITPQLLQYLAIENMKGADRIYVPIGTNGMPIVSTIPLSSK